MNKSHLFGGRDVLLRLLSDFEHVNRLVDHEYTYDGNTLVLRRADAGYFDMSLNGGEAKRVAGTELIRLV